MKNAKNILSMDVMQLSHYVRRRFHVSLLGTDDIDESRDLAFQILALKKELQENRREQLKIFYNLIQGSHHGFFSHKPNRKLYIGFPYLHSHYRENYRIFAGETPAGTSEIGDSLLINAGNLLSQLSFTSVCSHLDNFSKGGADRYLKKSHQYDEDVRVTKLYMKITSELLTKRSLPQQVNTDLHNALTASLKSWQLQPSEEHNVDHLIDLLAITAGVGVHDTCIMSSVESAILPKTLYLPTRARLMFLFGLSSLNQHIQIEPPISAAVENLILSFHRDYRSLDLKDSLLLIECFSNLKYRQRLLDAVVIDNITPRLAKIRLEDMVQLLKSFISLDFRCSRVIKEFENSNVFSTLTVVDLAVLSLLYEQLKYPSDSIKSKLKREGHVLKELAEKELLQQIGM